MAMIELQRPVAEPSRFVTNEDGEDDGVVQLNPPTEPRPLLVNPAFVAALFQAQGEPGVCILRLSDGRGFKVRGTYEDLKATLGYEDPERVS